MASTIKLVKDDTGPPIIASITDKNTGLPIDLTGATVVMSPSRCRCHGGRV